MIVEPASDQSMQKKLSLQDTNPSWHSSSSSTPSGSNATTRPLEDGDLGHEFSDLSGNETNPLLRDSHAVDLGPPPEFTPYQAEHFEQNHDVVSHDPHLNSDGEALYRFLLSQSETPPTYQVRCWGKHDEQQSRWVTERDSQGQSRSRRETTTETITDFDFCIDIVPEMADSRGPITWTVRDDEPAYRGKMVREFEKSTTFETTRQSTRRKATRKENKKFMNWVKNRLRLGLPPWIQQEDPDGGLMDVPVLSQTNGLQSSRSIRQWADEYCESQKYLKEFVYEKVIYGWNIEQLESAIRATIKTTPYNGTLSVEFVPIGCKVYIRPDNKVSRMLSNKWLKFLSIILFIFPFIWLFKRFHSRGGGRWEVCGCAYPLKQWAPLEDGEQIPPSAEVAGDTLPMYDSIAGSRSALTTTSSMRVSPNRYMQTPTGPKKLVGMKEGEWFRCWESVIKHAVIGRYISPIPLLPVTRPVSEAERLDGYNETPPLVDF